MARRPRPWSILYRPCTDLGVKLLGSAWRHWTSHEDRGRRDAVLEGLRTRESRRVPHPLFEFEAGERAR